MLRNRWAEQAVLTAAFCVLVVVPADANFRLDILSQPLLMRAGQSQTPPGIRGLKGYTPLSALATPWKATVRTCTTRYKINASGVIQRKERRAMRNTGFKFVFLRPAGSGISQRSPRSA